MRDEAGFQKALVIASNDLDEQTISSLHDQGAAIAVWGVGTRLVTAYDEPALGGVFKLSAVREPGGVWQYRVKLSEQAIKVSNPGVLQVRRFSDGAEFAADLMFDEEHPPGDGCVLIDPFDPTRRKFMEPGTPYEDLLVPIFREGQPIYESPPLDEIRRRVTEQLAGFHAGVKRFLHPPAYPGGLQESLHETKTRLVGGYRRQATGGRGKAAGCRLQVGQPGGGDSRR